jgi:hypothetical protein
MEKVVKALPFHLDHKNVLSFSNDHPFRRPDQNHCYFPSNFTRTKWTLISSRVIPVDPVDNGKSVYLGIRGLDYSTSLGSYQLDTGREAERVCNYSFVLPVFGYEKDGTQYVYTSEKNQTQISCWLKDDKGMPYVPAEWSAEFLIEDLERTN